MPLKSVVVETGSSNNYSVYIECTHERESPKRRRNLSSQRKSEISITPKKARRTDRKVTENSTFRVSRSTEHGHGLSSRSQNTFGRSFPVDITLRGETPSSYNTYLHTILRHDFRNFLNTKRNLLVPLPSLPCLSISHTHLTP